MIWSDAAFCLNKRSVHVKIDHSPHEYNLLVDWMMGDHGQVALILECCDGNFDLIIHIFKWKCAQSYYTSCIVVLAWTMWIPVVKIGLFVGITV